MSCANDAATCPLSRCLCLPDDGAPLHASRAVGAKRLSYNRYYETFADYKVACNQFFANLDAYAEQLRSLLTENFEIIREY